MAHHQQLLDWIENELIHQNLHLGDELPNDRVLAREVGISQNLMRESLKHCEEIGVLRLYEGRKKSIIGVLLREPASSAGPAIGLYLASSRAPRQDLLNTCLLLESYALAGPSFDQSALPELDRIVAAMQDAGTSLSDFHDLEADFHIQLGRLSGNALVSALLATLRDAMIEARFELVNRVPLWSATSARLRMEYRAIVDAARSGDPALAQTLLRANLHERFAEAGHQLDLPEDLGLDDEEPQFTLEPVDIDSHGLVPEEWGGAIEPDLFQALTTIQPIKAPAPQKVTEQPAVQIAPAPESSVEATHQSVEPTIGDSESQEVVEHDSQGGAESGESLETQEHTVGDVDVPEPAVPEQAEQPQYAESVPEIEERAVPTGSATRKRRGTVSPVVRATVIPPRQSAPKPVPVHRLGDQQPVQGEEKTATAAEQAPVRVEAVPVEGLEEKLRREEARLAAAKAAHRGETAPAEPVVPSVESAPASDDSSELQINVPAPTSEVPSSEPLSSESKRPTRVASKKLFDIVNYFGFKQVKAPHRAVMATDSPEEIEPVSADYLDSDYPDADVLDGYEYIDPQATEDDYLDGEEWDERTDAPWRDTASGDPVEGAFHEGAEQTATDEQKTPEPTGNLLGQKKGKKKSKKNRR